MKQQVAIVPDFSEPYDRTVVAGISRFVHESEHWRLYVPPDPQHRVSLLEKWTGDGIIANFDDPAVLEVVKRKRLPAVGFGGGEGYTGKHIRYLATDNQAIGRLGAEHLMDRGLRRYGYAAMPLSRRNQPWSEDRARSFKSTVESAGYCCSLFRTTDAVAGDWNRLLAALCRWLSRLTRPVGIMAAYDMLALHVLEACQELELRVPDDVAVLGVDNDEQVCELATPPLSSINQGGKQLGYQAAALLDKMMRGERPQPATPIQIPPLSVITRRSTDVLAIDDADVATALRFIHDHACSGILVADVVRQVAISRVSLEQRFKAEVGRTMHREIKRVQLDRVRELLRTTDMSIQQIASRTGFEYPQYLSNLFHRTFGQTLGQYRAGVRGGSAAGRG